tara:strand:+ start:259 stop:468 length:210 start_codon:yes stop_codon:yes gene_type:complete
MWITFEAQLPGEGCAAGLGFRISNPRKTRKNIREFGSFAHQAPGAQLLDLSTGYPQKNITYGEFRSLKA